MRGVVKGVAAMIAVLAFLPAAAQADHHLVRIGEVFPGTAAEPRAEFVELRMYNAGQNNFNPAADLVFYDASSTIVNTVELGDVASGATQQTLLASTSDLPDLFPTAGAFDTEYQDSSIANAGGGVCLVSTSFATIDCVAWGTATVAGAGPSTAAIPEGASLVRSEDTGCNTLLESGDDTNSSLADFVADEPTPEANGSTTGRSSCPDTSFVKTPKARSKDRTPVFKMAGASTFECRLDGAIFVTCPATYKPGKLPLGKHKLLVRATESDASIDGTPAKYSWKIVRP